METQRERGRKYEEEKLLALESRHTGKAAVCSASSPSDTESSLFHCHSSSLLVAWEEQGAEVLGPLSSRGSPRWNS